jgi:hypothetical protein
MRLDGNTAEYRNEVQKITAQKDEYLGNKVLHREKKGDSLLQMSPRVLIVVLWLTLSKTLVL